MNSSQLENQSSGQITSGIVQKTLSHKTINFVCSQLPAWRDDPERRSEDSEDKLNLQLCKFLDCRARNEFPMVRFDHEEYQFRDRRVDLSASPVQAIILDAKLYTKYDPILVLECKRLPAPSKEREKEYVTGTNEKKSGGIQRFKLGLHGADLEIVVIVGYLQKRTARYWHNEINSWILELTSGKINDGCVWDNDETLEILDEDMPKGLTSYRSVHVRTGSQISTKIVIHHLWVTMSSNSFPA